MEPISNVFGYDRGNQSIHRYYIDNFVAMNAGKIKGRTLEVAERTYTQRHGQQVTQADIIHYSEHKGDGSFIGDLTKQETLPEERFDTFVCTQTFNFIYDFKAAIQGSKYVLKPGGFLIATVSGIQQISTYDASRWGDYWRFTSESCKKGFGEIFGEANVEVTTFGNVLASIAALEGLSATELTKEELAFSDPSYEIIIGIVARKN
ncbi:methyltransferase domain-containing protein [Chryseolinea serpens]|uniref:methyltransferase domain-containing protein n=1 Tax=Chryseolinea serpens TaxID=947013 RepID=UPI0015C10A64|nr:methyltransferase domain-containing protein [Chryseolinea serpens]